MTLNICADNTAKHELAQAEGRTKHLFSTPPPPAMSVQTIHGIMKSDNLEIAILIIALMQK